MRAAAPDAVPWRTGPSFVEAHAKSVRTLTAVPVTNTRMWVETMKTMGLNHEYKEYQGATHGPIVEATMPDIFAFFARHAR
jgi:hypothetical protein